MSVCAQLQRRQAKQEINAQGCGVNIIKTAGGERKREAVSVERQHIMAQRSHNKINTAEMFCGCGNTITLKIQ